MIIIDVEIKKAILGRNETPIEGIEYCGGWRDFAGMGISCVCTYDIVSHLSRVFLEEDLHDFENYISGKPTAGFNTKHFDNTLLHHHGKDVEKVGGPHYDILEEIWVALGLNRDKFNPKTHGVWGLDAVCQATLGITKTGHGALAPVWWQQGKRGKVVDYCLNDVWMEGRLLQHILDGGLIYNGKEISGIAVQPPAQVILEPAFIPTRGVRESRPMDVNNIVGGPNEPALAEERRADRERAERVAAEVLNNPTMGGLGIIR